jgi:D-alanyl-D-alanine carboxypeptidase
MSELAGQLSAWLAQHGLPGAVAGVSRGRVRDVAAAGLADGPTGRPMTCDTAVRIASVTKPLTAVAAVLASGGSPDGLKRPVLDLLPELRTDWRASPRLLLRQVLGQVSGLRAGLDLQALANLGQGDNALIDACRLVARLGQAAPPGRDWAYYNGNYYLAGAALANLRGTTFETAIRDLVLRPAGLARTAFSAPADHALGHHQGRVIDEDYPRARRPSGGLWSTVTDLLSFAEFVLADPQLLAAIQAPRTGPSAPVQYGLGWALAPGLIFHNGRLDGFRSLLLVAPEHQYCVAMVANSTDALSAIASFVDRLQARLTGLPASVRLMFGPRPDRR